MTKDEKIKQLESYLNVAFALEPRRGDGKTLTRLNIILDFIESIEDATLKEVLNYINEMYKDSTVIDEEDIKNIKQQLKEKRYE